MFGLFLLVAITLLQGYVTWRVRSARWLTEGVSTKAWWEASALLCVGTVLAWTMSHGLSGAWAGTLEFVSMTWLAALFITATCLLAVDLVTAFGLLFKRLAPALRSCALAAGIAFSLAALVQGTRPPSITPYEAVLPGLPAALDGTVLVALSDIHLGALLDEGWMAARVEQVQELHPDMIVLVGDLFEGHGAPASRFITVLKGLNAPLGVWAVTGNHEFYGGAASAINALEASGVGVLHDRSVEVRPGLILAGIDGLNPYRRSGKEGDPVAKALRGRPPGGTIFLSHVPWRAEEAAGEGVGLMVSGHTHGGQVWPFGYLVRLVHPYFQGRYQVGGMTLLVCRGTGTWGPRMRLWRRGEILSITLRAAPQ